MKTIIKVLVPVVVIYSAGEVYHRRSDEMAELHYEREAPTADPLLVSSIAQYTGATATSIVVIRPNNH